MDISEKTNEKPAGDSDLFKAVKLLEENDFYVISADTEQHQGSTAERCLGYTGALIIKAYPKRFVKNTTQPDPVLIF